MVLRWDDRFLILRTKPAIETVFGEDLSLRAWNGLCVSGKFGEFKTFRIAQQSQTRVERF